MMDYNSWVDTWDSWLGGFVFQHFFLSDHDVCCKTDTLSRSLRGILLHAFDVLWWKKVADIRFDHDGPNKTHGRPGSMGTILDMGPPSQSGNVVEDHVISHLVSRAG